MNYQDLLIHVDDAQGTPARLRTALTLAKAHQARLTGLYVLPDFNIALYAAEAGPALIAQERAAGHQRAQEQHIAFKNAAHQVGVAVEWRCVEGDPAHHINRAARCHDLIIIGQSDHQDMAALDGGLASQVLLGAGRPVLVVPYIGSPETIGERILLAWNASREATRALHDALPLLASARHVHVLIIDSPSGNSPVNAVASAALEQHLAHHGVMTHIERLPAGNVDMSDVLLSRAADEGADSIVMGAYGHSRLREIILGGMTRHLLQYMTVPVLMSH